MLRVLLAISCLAALAPSALAQSAGSCANQPSRNDLDFWTGSWNVYDSDGAFAGRHVVTEWETGCLIEAVWTGADGSTQQSMNVFDPLLGSWRQLLVSPHEIADLRGSFSGGAMTLSGNLFTLETQATTQRRLTITTNGDGTLTYQLDQRDGAADPWMADRTFTARDLTADTESHDLPVTSDYLPGQPDCWGLPQRADFAFAAGFWNVGAANNFLASLQSGCLIRERWAAGGNNTGVSYNFFDPFAGQWRQVWISPTIFIDMVGGVSTPGSAMRMQGQIVYHNGRTAPFRASWTPQSPTWMVQFMEEQNNGSWSTWFNASYFRASNTVSGSVSFAGLGSGEVSSQPAGISCANPPDGCSAPFPLEAPVTLSGNAANGSTFAGWVDGPCFGQAGDCTFNISEATEAVARFTLDDVPDGRIVAALLPGARSGYLGGPDLTVFATVLSRASTPAQGCRITAPDGAPAALSYRRVDAANVPAGPPDPVFDLGNGGSASFVLTLQPIAETAASGTSFAPVIMCENATLATVPGVNTLSLSIDDAPVPDILSISATPSADGVIRIGTSGGISFMSASAINIGAGDGSAGTGEATITVFADDGGAGLPLTLQVCETGPQGGCLAPRSDAVTTVFGSEAKFFAVFVRAQAGSGIDFSPASARVFLRFRDANGVIRSVTSAAITAPD